MSMLDNLTQPLKYIARRLLYGSVASVAAEETATLHIDVLEVQEKVFEKTIEVARKTRPHRESDDEFERMLANDFASTLRETSLLGRAMLGLTSPDERQEVLSGPLSDSASGSTPSLPAATRPSIQAQPLQPGPSHQPLQDQYPNPNPSHQPPTNGTATSAEPEKRKRGRPSNEELQRRAEAVNGSALSNGNGRNGQL